MAPKTPLTDAVAKRIADYVRAGNYVIVAAHAAGIHRDTYYEWLHRGAKERARIADGLPPDDHETKFAEFSEIMEKAIAEAEVRNLLIVSRAGESQWQAAAWILERKHHKRWGRKDRHEVTGGKPGSEPVKFRVEFAEPFNANNKPK